ncbi:MAG: hypothetical protein ACLQD8_05265 [Thermoplasmata archaeon]
MEIRTQTVLQAGRSRAAVIPATFHRDSFRVGRKIVVGVEGDFVVIGPANREAEVARLLVQLAEGGPGP